MTDMKLCGATIKISDLVAGIPALLTQELPLCSDPEIDFAVSADELYEEYLASKAKAFDLFTRAAALSGRGELLVAGGSEDTKLKLRCINDILKPQSMQSNWRWAWSKKNRKIEERKPAAQPSKKRARKGEVEK